MKAVLFGPPGAGKGTVASLLAAQSNVPHISTGNLFREAIKNQTELGNKVKAVTESGALVPDDLTVELVKQRLHAEDTKHGFLLDGFPRTVAQADALSTLVDIDRVVDITVTDETIIERLSGRRVCKSCGASYHITFVPPRKQGICDTCGGELYQRADDSIVSINRRLQAYEEQTAVLIQYYRDRNLLIEIDGSPDPETVRSNVASALGL